MKVSKKFKIMHRAVIRKMIHTMKLINIINNKLKTIIFKETNINLEAFFIKETEKDSD